MGTAIMQTPLSRAVDCAPEVWQKMHAQVYTGDGCEPPMISASTVATIMGRNPWKSAYTLFQQMRGRVPYEEETPEMRAGKAAEPEVARRYEETTKRKVYDPGEFAIHIHPEFPFLYATLDRIDDTGRAVELKSPSVFASAAWEEGAPPLIYQVQNQVQIACAQLEHGALCAVPRGRESVFYHYDFDRHDAAIKKMIDAAIEFRERVVNDDAPEIDYSESTIETLKALHPDDDGSVVEAHDLSPVADEYATAQEERKAAEKREAELKARLISRFGSATYLIIDGKKFSYKTKERAEHFVKASKFRVLRACK